MGPLGKQMPKEPEQVPVSLVRDFLVDLGQHATSLFIYRPSGVASPQHPEDYGLPLKQSAHEVRLVGAFSERLCLAQGSARPLGRSHG